mgnify:CR=1 FL=1
MLVIQIIGSILGVLGLTFHLFWLFFIGGILCIILDIVGFFTRKLRPLFPIILYILGYVFIGNWTGILLGSIVGNIIEMMGLLIGLPIFYLKNHKV